eukprot:33958-Pelagomonas_calceolata.AAC.3
MMLTFKSTGLLGGCYKACGCVNLKNQSLAWPLLPPIAEGTWGWKQIDQSCIANSMGQQCIAFYVDTSMD